MRIYWTIQRIPEMQGLDPATRKAAWRACVWRSFRHWQVWMVWLFTVLCVLAGMLLGAYVGGFHDLLLKGFFGIPIEPERYGQINATLDARPYLMLWQICGGVLGAAFGGAIFGQILTGFTRPYLREYLSLPAGPAR